MDPRHSPDRDELVRIWHGELLTIADLAAGLDGHQWQAPSPCPGWTVGDLVAHVIDTETAVSLLLIGSQSSHVVVDGVVS